MSLISCPLTGTVFDPATLPRNPFRVVPGTRIPIDHEGVDTLFPKPSASDPNVQSKQAARDQALADAEVYAALAPSLDDDNKAYAAKMAVINGR